MGERELSFGEKAVGLTFNPGNNPSVDELKEAAAKFIDLCHNMTLPYPSTPANPEVVRMASIAITNAQTAQMWAVKAATWKN